MELSHFEPLPVVGARHIRDDAAEVLHTRSGSANGVVRRFRICCRDAANAHPPHPRVRLERIPRRIAEMFGSELLVQRLGAWSLTSTKLSPTSSFAWVSKISSWRRAGVSG